MPVGLPNNRPAELTVRWTRGRSDVRPIDRPANVVSAICIPPGQGLGPDIGSLKEVNFDAVDSIMATARRPANNVRGTAQANSIPGGWRQTCPAPDVDGASPRECPENSDRLGAESNYLTHKWCVLFVVIRS